MGLLIVVLVSLVSCVIAYNLGYFASEKHYLKTVDTLANQLNEERLANRHSAEKMMWDDMWDE